MMKREFFHIMKLSRPRFWLYLAGPALLGLVYGVEHPGSLLTAESIGLFVFFLIPANVFLYSINDIFDRRIDRQNPKKDEKEVRFDGAPRLTVTATAAAGAITLGIIPFLQGVALAAFLLFVALSVGYSVPPVRFKARPFLDSVSNGLYIVPGVVTYAGLTGALPPLLIIAAGWMWTMAMHTFSAIPDILPDRQAGVSTTATTLGRRKALLYCTLAWGGAAVAGGSVSVGFGLVLALYPVLSAVYWYRDMEVDAIYWYYPYINGIVGMVMTFGGLLTVA